mgnify:CR=1 FL=1
MKTKLRSRSMGLAALALTASMGLAACGNEADDDSASEPTTSETSEELLDSYFENDNLTTEQILSGLRAHRGSILAEFIEDELDLVGIGRLLATTPNDEVNALADVSPGFVWRLQSESGNATDIQPTHDPLFLVNMSVWSDADALYLKDWSEYPYKGSR